MVHTAKYHNLVPGVSVIKRLTLNKFAAYNGRDLVSDPVLERVRDVYFCTPSGCPPRSSGKKTSRSLFQELHVSEFELPFWVISVLK